MLVRIKPCAQEDSGWFYDCKLDFRKYKKLKSFEVVKDPNVDWKFWFDTKKQPYGWFSRKELIFIKEKK